MRFLVLSIFSMEEKNDPLSQLGQTTFIQVDTASPHENIFNELSGELGDLEFAEKKADTLEPKKRDWLATGYAVSGIVSTVFFFIFVVLLIDVTFRTQDDNSFVGNLGLCSYLAWGVENYDNPECKTIAMIHADSEKDKADTEKTIVSNLILLAPKELQSIDILNSPKVRFIQDHTGDNRISISETMARFMEIKNRTAYQGEDIDCKNLVTNEKGELSVTCDVYGGAVLGPARGNSISSRETALSFIEALQDPTSNFQLIQSPKSLEIAAYSSSDVGLRSVFSTKTTISLKLRYLPPNKI